MDPIHNTNKADHNTHLCGSYLGYEVISYGTPAPLAKISLRCAKWKHQAPHLGECLFHQATKFVKTPRNKSKYEATSAQGMKMYPIDTNCATFIGHTTQKLQMLEILSDR
eukprot:Gb_05608 [translate_table: standard]